MKQTIVAIGELRDAMNTSRHERILASQIEDAGLPKPEREYQFFAGRNWRFDFCWVEQQLAVEVEGGLVRVERRDGRTYWLATRGHASPNRFMADIEKYNQTALLGFCLLRFPGPLVEDGTAIREIRRFFEERKQIR